MSAGAWRAGLSGRSQPCLCYPVDLSTVCNGLGQLNGLHRDACVRGGVQRPARQLAVRCATAAECININEKCRQAAAAGPPPCRRRRRRHPHRATQVAASIAVGCQCTMHVPICANCMFQKSSSASQQLRAPDRPATPPGATPCRGAGWLASASASRRCAHGPTPYAPMKDAGVPFR